MVMVASIVACTKSKKEKISYKRIDWNGDSIEIFVEDDKIFYKKGDAVVDYLDLMKILQSNNEDEPSYFTKKFNNDTILYNYMFTSMGDTIWYNEPQGLFDCMDSTLKANGKITIGRFKKSLRTVIETN